MPRRRSESQNTQQLVGAQTNASSVKAGAVSCRRLLGSSPALLDSPHKQDPASGIHANDTSPALNPIGRRSKDYFNSRTMTVEASYTERESTRSPSIRVERRNSERHELSAIGEGSSAPLLRLGRTGCG
jgi:hypothetical protein